MSLWHCTCAHQKDDGAGFGVEYAVGQLEVVDEAAVHGTLFRVLHKVARVVPGMEVSTLQRKGTRMTNQREAPTVSSNGEAARGGR